MQFTDNTTSANTRLTADGYLVGTASVARTGVQVYHGSEIGGGNGLRMTMAMRASTYHNILS